MKSLKIQYGVPEASKIKSAVNEIEEAIEDLNYDAIDIEIGIAPKPIIEFDEEEEWLQCHHTFNKCCSISH